MVMIDTCRGLVDRMVEMSECCCFNRLNLYQAAPSQIDFLHIPGLHASSESVEFIDPRSKGEHDTALIKSGVSSARIAKESIGELQPI